ncbi:MAG: prepilin peptidase [Alphaproteobacteria bacterium]
MIIPSPAHLLTHAASPWLAVFLWAMLGWTAFIDARSGRVPDRLLIAGAAGAALAMAILMPPSFLLARLVAAVICGGIIWALNELWYYFRKRDALGMGDAKWSMLAAFGFGAAPVLWAWVAAAWLGLGLIGVMRLIGRPLKRVHFAPFLLVGLAIAKLWLS